MLSAALSLVEGGVARFVYKAEFSYSDLSQESSSTNLVLRPCKFICLLNIKFNFEKHA